MIFAKKEANKKDFVMPRRPNSLNKALKQDKFKELANKRVNVALDKLRLIGNLANTKYYDYSPDQVDAICKRLNEEVQLIRKKFQGSSDDQSQFKL